jgi:hypothetical protein
VVATAVGEAAATHDLSIGSTPYGRQKAPRRTGCGAFDLRGAAARYRICLLAFLPCGSVSRRAASGPSVQTTGR